MIEKMRKALANDMKYVYEEFYRVKQNPTPEASRRLRFSINCHKQNAQSVIGFVYVYFDEMTEDEMKNYHDKISKFFDHYEDLAWDM